MQTQGAGMIHIRGRWLFHVSFALPLCAAASLWFTEKMNHAKVIYIFYHKLFVFSNSRFAGVVCIFRAGIQYAGTFNVGKTYLPYAG